MYYPHLICWGYFEVEKLTGIILTCREDNTRDCLCLLIILSGEQSIGKVGLVREQGICSRVCLLTMVGMIGMTAYII